MPFAPKTISAPRALALGAVLGLLLALWVPNLLGATSLTAETGHARWLEAAALGAIFLAVVCGAVGTLVASAGAGLAGGAAVAAGAVAALAQRHAHFFALGGAGVGKQRGGKCQFLFGLWGWPGVAGDWPGVLLYAAGCWWAWRLDVRWHHRSRVIW